MINLLPSIVKQEYRYALRNTVLRRWLVSVVLAIVGLGVVATYGLAVLQHSTDNYQHQVQQAQLSLQQQHLTETEAQVKDISNSLKLAVQVLSKEVLFSKLLRQIATVIPNNAVLTGLNISQAANALDLSVSTTDYATASQVQVNLQDPNNKIFSKADIQSITCTNSSDATTSKYPCAVQIRALLASDNPYLFINNTTP